MSIRTFSPYLALFLSGSAALIYQASWGRMLQRVFGVSDLAIATVLAAFFLGLGLGSALGGRWGRKTERPARLYFILEVLIGVYALVSLLILPNIHALYAWVSPDASFFVLTSVRLVLALLILLPPTILMGATLPVLIALVSRGKSGWSAPATWLYATNTIGATVGAGLTGLYLVPQLGTRLTIIVAALASVAAALVVGAAFRGVRSEHEVGGSADAPPAPSPVGEPAQTTRPNNPRLAIWLAGLAGIASLSGEVLWTRVLRLVLQGTTQAFSVMLVNFLFGIAVGSLIAERLLRRGGSPLRIFAWSQTLLGVLSVGAMVVAGHLPRLIGLLHGRPDLVPYEAWVILTVSAILLLPLALVLGTSIPLAWKIAEGRVEDAPKQAGRILAANTLGGLAGSLLTGFLLVQYMGVEAAILVIAFLHLVIAAMAFRHSVGESLIPRVLAWTAPIALGALLLQAEPSLHLRFLLQARHHASVAVIEGPGERWEEPIVYLREGRNTTVTITHTPPTLRLFNDGRPESGFGPGEIGFGAELVTLGSLPTLFAAQHGKAMIVGLGAGHSTAVLLDGPWEEVEVVELESGVVEAARLLYEAKSKPFPLDDPRANIIVDDARARLALAEPGSYDAIVSQPSHPWLAGSSALYTKEFFAECDSALRDGGVLSLWVNLFRIEAPQIQSVVATLGHVFPHMLGFVLEESSLILAASDQPFELNEELDRRVRAHPHYLQVFDIDNLESFIATVEMDNEGLQAFAAGAPLIEDDRPLLEFVLGRTAPDSGVSLAEIDIINREVPWLSTRTWDTVPVDSRGTALLERVAAIATRQEALVRLDAFLETAELAESNAAVVRGSMAEARGDVRGALEAYDASGTADAAWRADALRMDERMFWSLIQHARVREEQASDATPLLRAGLALRHRGAIRDSLRLAPASDEELPQALRSAAETFLEGGCSALMQLPNATFETLADDEHAALMLQECSAREGDLVASVAYGERRLRARRITAVSEGRRGDDALTAGNGGLAMRHYRRALGANPGHGGAAAGLARLLDALERRPEAEAILRTAAVAARGLPASTSSLQTVARDLEFEIEGLTDDDEEAPAMVSAAPSEPSES